MRLATIDPHSVKEHTEIYKIPTFGVNRPNSGSIVANRKIYRLVPSPSLNNNTYTS